MFFFCSHNETVIQINVREKKKEKVLIMSIRPVLLSDELWIRIISSLLAFLLYIRSRDRDGKR